MVRFIYTFFFIGLVFLISCDTSTELDAIGSGPNLFGFVNTSQTLNAVADGEEYQYTLQMEINGPSIAQLSNDIVATIVVDPSSTAIEGTHFRLNKSSFTLIADNNYLGLFDFIILTEGVTAPASFEAVLVVSETSGEGNVVGNGKPMTVILNFGCPSNLAGTYDLTVDYIRPDGSSAKVNYIDEIVERGVGEYRTTIDHHWGNLGVGTSGFTFYDVCDDISGPGQFLADFYSNWIDFITGTHDPVTNTIHIEYSICFPAGGSACFYYDNTWVKK